MDHFERPKKNQYLQPNNWIKTFGSVNTIRVIAMLMYGVLLNKNNSLTESVMFDQMQEQGKLSSLK